MSQLSEQVLEISIQYLGPAAERFLDQQMKAHMNGRTFADLEASDISELAGLVRIFASLIIDKKKADELAEKISRLG